MDGPHQSDSDPNPQARSVAAWPLWARRLATLALLFHITAVLAGALAASPSSPLERAAADLFGPYHQVIDQGYGYHYYAPEPGPTPVVTATLRAADGSESSIRLPDRSAAPRLRYQRQLALASHLVADFEEARRETGDGAQSVYAKSYARHIARSHPGCVTITLSAQMHLIPDPLAVQAAIQAGKPLDLDAEEFYTVPERIGEFPCDAF